jgi:hypothetical protein
MALLRRADRQWYARQAASTEDGPCLKSPSGTRTRRKGFQDS